MSTKKYQGNTKHLSLLITVKGVNKRITLLGGMENGTYITNDIAEQRAIENTERFIASVPKAKRKKYGQFFTNSTTAKFMASLFCFDLSKQKIEILDAGAGTGILAAAVVQKLYELGYVGKIYVTCYETDELVMPILEENMALCNKLHNVYYTIKRENYVTSQNFSNSTSFNNEDYQYDYLLYYYQYDQLQDHRYYLLV